MLELRAEPADVPDEVRVLGRQHVADGVGKIDRGRAGLHGGTADDGDELGIGARCVLAREFDLVHARGRTRDRRRCVGDDLVGREAKLLLHVEGAGGEEDVDPRARRTLECGRRRVDVGGARAAQRGNGDTLRRLRDCPHSLEVAGRSGRKAGLDHVHAEPFELLADLHLLVRPQGDSRRLLAVPKRRVENCDPARAQRVSSLTRPREADGPVASDVGVCALQRVVDSPPRGGESGG